MKISILSDLHNEFDEFTPCKQEFDVVVLAGDIHLGTNGIKWAKKHYSDQQRILYVPGNHEFYNYKFPNMYAEIAEKTQGTNITMLEQKSVVIDKVRFLGCTLWTDFSITGEQKDNMDNIRRSMNDYYVIHHGESNKPLLPTETYAHHKASVEWLKQQLHKYKTDKIVVITHHAPSKKSLTATVNPKEVWPAYASDLEQMIIAAPNIELWVHGHTHHAWDYKIGKTRVVCNPRGYPRQKSGFKADFQVHI